jgi:hypothetical protein
MLRPSLGLLPIYLRRASRPLPLKGSGRLLGAGSSASEASCGYHPRQPRWCGTSMSHICRTPFVRCSASDACLSTFGSSFGRPPSCQFPAQDPIARSRPEPSRWKCSPWRWHNTISTWRGSGISGRSPGITAAFASEVRLARSSAEPANDMCNPTGNTSQAAAPSTFRPRACGTIPFRAV